MSHPSHRCGRERLLRTIQIGVRSIESLRFWFVENRLEACLTRKKQERPSIPRMFDGEKKTMLIAVACSPAPKDRARWTRNLLADRVVELRILESCSPATIQRVLRKNELKRWCIPSEQDAEFVCAMWNVLEVYTRPYDS